ncbi:FRG domain-containing protein [soil metagenome]
MEEIHLSSWSEFTAHSAVLDGWAFRGQRVAQWPIVSSLMRHLQLFCPDQSLWQLREERALRVFRRKAHVYLRDPSVLDDDLRCLALMQHHGAPTRLIDFTKSPFAAAFFAFQRAEDSVAVYAINTPALWRSVPRDDPSLVRDAIDPRRAGNYERYFISNRHPVVWFGEPNQMDARLVAQSGVLVMPGVLNQPLDQILARYDGNEPLLRKFVMPVSIRDEAMQSLYRMNITQATLFPDLDGLARSITYELEMVWSQLIDDFRARQSSE